jgi:hypothetical protein
MLGGCIGSRRNGGGRGERGGTVVSSGPTEDSETPGTDTVASARHLGSFVLWNDRSAETELNLTVTDENRQILSTTRTMPPGESVEVANPIRRQGTYTVAADLRDGASETVRWTVDSCHEATYVQIRVEPGPSLTISEKRRTVAPTPECSQRGTDGTDSETDDGDQL